MEGFVYVMSNLAMPGLVKVGMTEKMPHLRAQEMSAHEGLPSKMQLEYYALVSGRARMIEQEVHKDLETSHAGKEWFRCEKKIAIAAIKKVAASAIQHERFINAEREEADREHSHQLQLAARKQAQCDAARAAERDRYRIIQELLSDFYRLEPIARKTCDSHKSIVRALVHFNDDSPASFYESLDRWPLPDILLLNQYNSACYLLEKAGRLPQKGWLERELKGDYFEVPSFVIDEIRRRFQAATDKKPFWDSCYSEIRNWYGART